MPPSSERYPAQLVSIGISENDGTGFPRHQHDAGPELVAVLEGVYRFEAQNEIQDLRPGHLVVIPASMPHQLLSGRPWKSLYLLSEKVRDFPLKDLAVVRPGRSSRIIALMQNLYAMRREPCPDDALHALLEAILVLLKAELATQDQPPLSPPISKAVQWLDQDISRPFNAEELARHVGLGLSTLNKLFREQTGESPLRYLTRLRMQRAQVLLRDPYLTIQEIAIQCGSSDVNYFIRRFRQHYGVSPRRWSKRRPF